MDSASALYVYRFLQVDSRVWPRHLDGVLR